MPDTHSKRGGTLSPDEHLRMYELLFLMNAAFHTVLTCILQVREEFEQHLNGLHIAALEQFAREFQGDANGYLLGRFQPLELAERDMFRRLREAREEEGRERQPIRLNKPAKPQNPGGAILNPEQRLRVYELLQLMNGAFNQIDRRVMEVHREFGSYLSAERLQQLLELARELQSYANHDLLEKFTIVELHDCNRYGRVRKDREEGWREMERIPLRQPAKLKEPEKS